MDNRFLQDFMRRQSTLIESAIPEPAPKKKGARPKHGTRDGKHPFGGDDMEARLATIIKEKSPKREVLQFFRDRVSQLVSEDDF